MTSKISFYIKLIRSDTRHRDGFLHFHALSSFS